MNGQGLLSGWSIVVVGGMQLIGRLQYGNERTMAPAYTFNVSMNDRGVGYFCTPLFMLPSIEGIAVPEGAIVIPCANLSKKDQERVAGALKNCEATVRAMRAHDAGILLADKMPSGTGQKP